VLRTWSLEERLLSVSDIEVSAVQAIRVSGLEQTGMSVQAEAGSKVL
jgi:hypothetical protein